ncbi:MAG TPA: hypothetical protein VE911_03070 [Candidatus Nitrosopolaris sp.]|nr:hypothetical protein [Candidatus Nitrosopolaris sp.]
MHAPSLGVQGVRVVLVVDLGAVVVVVAGSRFDTSLTKASATSSSPCTSLLA